MLRLCEPLGPDLLPIAQDLVALAKDPADPTRGYDLLNRSYATPAAAAGRAAIRRDPQIAPLINERYRGPWPSIEELLALPADSLGHRYAAWMRACGLDIPPPFTLPEGLDCDDAWIHRRTRQTHDLWHVVLGCPPSPAGDADIGLAVAFGLRLSAVCASLLAQRWEDGWHRPLADWQQELGIAAMLQESPFREVAWA